MLPTQSPVHVGVIRGWISRMVKIWKEFIQSKHVLSYWVILFIGF